MKILTIGAAMRDLFLEYENPQRMPVTLEGANIVCLLLEEGKKIELTRLSQYTGGGSTNAACSFTKLGFSVSSFFKIGTDSEGAFIISTLQQAGIDLSAIVQTTSEITGTSFIIPSPSGNKVILVYRGANLAIHREEVPFTAIQACDLVYITSLGGTTSHLLPTITTYARNHHKQIAVNPGTSQLTAHVDTLEQSLTCIDILVLNSFEASLFMKHIKKYSKTSPHSTKKGLPPLLATPIMYGSTSFTLNTYFHEILRRGPRIAVVTNGADGVYATDGTQIYYHPSIPKKPVSTVGAGDAFSSTFVAQLLYGTSIEDAVRAGIINSCEVIAYLGATTGLLTREQLTTYVRGLDRKLMQAFEL